jgi:hypothetical protein
VQAVLCLLPGAFLTFCAWAARVCLQLRLKEIDQDTFKRVMGLTAADADWDELPEGVGVEPE